MIQLIALVTVAFLQLASIWPHLSTPWQQHLTADATGYTTTRATLAVANPAAIPPLPMQIHDVPLSLTAASAYAIDVDTGTVLYANNATQTRPIASITKLITTMVVLSRHAPNARVVIPTLPTYAPDDELIGLVPGESYELSDLVTAALVQSGDDAADAMAIWDAGSIPAFTKEMNAKMSEWGIQGTHFSSASGLQDQNNYATAQAVAQIAKLAIADPLVARVVAEPTATITSLGGRILNFTNIDTLLAGGEFYGIKTGYTESAGECFVGLARINGHAVITVVLGSNDRFGDSQALANWISSNFVWQ